MVTGVAGGGGGGAGGKTKKDRDFNIISIYDGKAILLFFFLLSFSPFWGVYSID